MRSTASILVGLFAIAGFPADALPLSNPIVSRNVPIYTINEIYSPQQGNNATYFDEALCAVPCYLALDLNSAGVLGRVQVAWYGIQNGFLHTLV